MSMNDEDGHVRERIVIEAESFDVAFSKARQKASDIVSGFVYEANRQGHYHGVFVLRFRAAEIPITGWSSNDNQGTPDFLFELVEK